MYVLVCNSIRRYSLHSHRLRRIHTLCQYIDDYCNEIDDHRRGCLLELEIESKTLEHIQK